MLAIEGNYAIASNCNKAGELKTSKKAKRRPECDAAHFFVHRPGGARPGANSLELRTNSRAERVAARHARIAVVHVRGIHVGALGQRIIVAERPRATRLVVPARIARIRIRRERAARPERHRYAALRSVHVPASRVQFVLRIHVLRVDLRKLEVVRQPELRDALALHAGHERAEIARAAVEVHILVDGRRRERAARIVQLAAPLLRAVVARRVAERVHRGRVQAAEARARVVDRVVPARIADDALIGRIRRERAEAEEHVVDHRREHIRIDERVEEDRRDEQLRRQAPGAHRAVRRRESDIRIAAEERVAVEAAVMAVLRAEEILEREDRLIAAAEILGAAQPPVRRRHSAALHAPRALPAGEFLRADPFVDLPVELNARLRARARSAGGQRRHGGARESGLQRAAEG
ncbi:hypothetical protein BP1258A_5425 [Burkholderia pseudomallei 1258a]|nr:hypothetical protein BP1258B_5982 [Burkholderia pseudomallei 1258b]EIF53673.1 hypothetical protein BP1258A_5425 [Burkholderia pseudomallei 1258a]